MRRLLPFAALFSLTLSLPHVAHADALPRGVMPVIRANGHSYVALRATVDESWGRGGSRLLRRANPTVAVRNVRLSALPREVREDIRGTLRVQNGGGDVCRARMARPVLLRRADAAFASDEWDGLYGGPRLSDEEVARAFWDVSAVSSLLVARLIPSHGRCRMGTWASRATLAFGTTTTDIPDALAVAFRSVEQYGWLAEVWPEVRIEAGETAEHWDERPDAGRMMTSLRVGAREFRLIGAAGESGCGDFTGGAWGLFELTDAGPVLLREGGRVDPPYGLADLDGDGVPEVIGHQRALMSTTGETVDVSAPFFGCPC
ncbi:MAG: hypothetical protein AB8I08_20255 [Sandaracinaceae bacterium]